MPPGDSVIAGQDCTNVFNVSVFTVHFRLSLLSWQFLGFKFVKSYWFFHHPSVDDFFIVPLWQCFSFALFHRAFLMSIVIIDMTSYRFASSPCWRFVHCPRLVDNVIFCTFFSLGPFFRCRLCFNWHDILPVFALSPCWRFVYCPLVDNVFSFASVSHCLFDVVFRSHVGEIYVYLRLTSDSYRLYHPNFWRLVSFSLFLSICFLCICFTMSFLCRLSARSLMDNAFSVWHNIPFFIALDDWYFFTGILSNFFSVICIWLLFVFILSPVDILGTSWLVFTEYYPNLSPCHVAGCQ